MAISQEAQRNHDALLSNYISTLNATDPELYAQSPKDELHIQRFLSANCFGDYYTRTGLDLKTRELLTFAMIASMGGCEPQLAGHFAANLAIGNDRRILLSTITQLLPFIGYPRTLNAIRIINEGKSA
jgi:4-carboxymuconolactone decarboxylase